MDWKKANLPVSRTDAELVEGTVNPKAGIAPMDIVGGAELNGSPDAAINEMFTAAMETVEERTKFDPIESVEGFGDPMFDKIASEPLKERVGD